MDLALTLLVLILDTYAIFEILRGAAGGGRKLLWILLIVGVPLAGFAAWILAGPRAKKAIQ